MSARRFAWMLILSFACSDFSADMLSEREAGSRIESASQSVSLVINEYLADPAGNSSDDLEGDANGDGVRSSSQDEFVELVNAGVDSLDIGGFTVSDAAQVRFRFPGGTVMPPGEAVVVFGGGQPAGDFGNARQNGLVFTSSGLNFNNGVDSIVVRDPFAAEVARRDYPSVDGAANQSLTRSPDVTGEFLRHSTVVDGNGALFSPGARLDGSPFTVAPHIARLTPARVLQSDAPFDMRVEGDNFDIAAVVQIDLLPLATTRLDATTLTAFVPDSVASRAGDHMVTVVNPDGNRSNGVTLTIDPLPPVLYSLSPSVVEIGSGPLTIFAQGLNFTPQSKVLVEEAVVATFYLDARGLAATIPESLLDAPGGRRITVRNPDGQMSGTRGLEVIRKRPRLTSIRPQQILAGGPAFSLEVSGANFTTDTIVFLNQTLLATRFVSSSLLVAEVPEVLLTEVGLRSVTVQNDSSGAPDELALRVVAVAPRLDALSPASSSEGGDDLRVRLSGAGYQRGAVVRVLTAKSTWTPLDTTFVSPEQLDARMPAALLQTAGDLLLRAENPDFGVSNEEAFRVLIKDPLVINEYLADPPDGGAGDANGDGARSSSQDEFIEIVNRTNEAIDISGFRLSDAESLRHTFAAGTVIPAFEAVVVFGGGSPRGRFGNAAENTLVFTASSGGLSLNNGGDVITLADAQGRVVQEVKFGAAEGGANESINRDPDAGGAVFVPHRRVGFGQPFSPGARATGRAFTTRPVIHALSPASARVRAENLSLTITGENFLPGAVVLFGQSVLTTVFYSASAIEVRPDPEMVAEGGFIELRVENPKGERSAVVRFLLVDDPPRIDTVTPKKVGTGAENLEIFITGERLQRAAVVTLAGQPVPVRVVQNQNAPLSLIAVAPAKFFLTAGDLPLQVINADGNLSSTQWLRVENGPLITRLSQAKIKAGSGDVEMTVSGVAFAPDVELFLDEQPVPTRFLNDSSCTARIPARLTAAPGQLILQARHRDGGRSNRVSIRVVE